MSLKYLALLNTETLQYQTELFYKCLFLYYLKSFNKHRTLVKPYRVVVFGCIWVIVPHCRRSLALQTTHHAKRVQRLSSCSNLCCSALPLGWSLVVAGQRYFKTRPTNWTEPTLRCPRITQTATRHPGDCWSLCTLHCVPPSGTAVLHESNLHSS